MKRLLFWVMFILLSIPAYPQEGGGLLGGLVEAFFKGVMMGGDSEPIVRGRTVSGTIVGRGTAGRGLAGELRGMLVEGARTPEIARSFLEIDTAGRIIRRGTTGISEVAKFETLTGKLVREGRAIGRISNGYLVDPQGLRVAKMSGFVHGESAVLIRGDNSIAVARNTWIEVIRYNNANPSFFEVKLRDSPLQGLMRRTDIALMPQAFSDPNAPALPREFTDSQFLENEHYSVFLKGCALMGGNINCELEITSKTRNNVICAAQAVIFDQQGKRYWTRNLDEDVNIRYRYVGHPSYNLPYLTPITVQYAFEGATDSTKMVNSFAFEIPGDHHHGEPSLYGVFENFPLRNSAGEALPKPSPTRYNILASADYDGIQYDLEGCFEKSIEPKYIDNWGTHALFKANVECRIWATASNETHVSPYLAQYSAEGLLYPERWTSLFAKGLALVDSYYISGEGMSLSSSLAPGIPTLFRVFIDKVPPTRSFQTLVLGLRIHDEATFRNVPVR
ncbi:hypothetical protein D4R52_03605 [bacterium]|nr:MAG: hypothetical protein D4R52_03605 [bacterium]